MALASAALVSCRVAVKPVPCHGATFKPEPARPGLSVTVAHSLVTFLPGMGPPRQASSVSGAPLPSWQIATHRSPLPENPEPLTEIDEAAPGIPLSGETETLRGPFLTVVVGAAAISAEASAAPAGWGAAQAGRVRPVASMPAASAGSAATTHRRGGRADMAPLSVAGGRGPATTRRPLSVIDLERPDTRRVRSGQETPASPSPAPRSVTVPNASG